MADDVCDILFNFVQMYGYQCEAHNMQLIYLDNVRYTMLRYLWHSLPIE